MTAQEVRQDIDLDQVIKKLSVWEKENFPAEAVDTVNEHQEIFEPIFLDKLDAYAAYDLAELYEDDAYLFSIIYTLAKYQSKPAYRKIIALLVSLENEAFNVFGDLMLEDMPYILAACYDGDLEPLKELMLAPESDDECRSCVFQTITILCQINQLPQDQGIAFLELAAHKFLTTDSLLEINLDHVFFFLLLELFELSAERCKKLIEGQNISFHDEFYQQEVELWFKDAEEENVSSQQSNTTKYQELVTGGLHVLSHIPFFSGEKEFEDDELWDDFDDFESVFGEDLSTEITARSEKVGRNNPCPCGSGQKYKKCCLRQDEQMNGGELL